MGDSKDESGSNTMWKWQERDTFSGSRLRVNIEVGRAPTVAYILVYKLQVDIQLNYLPIYTHAAAYPILAVQSNLLTVMTHNSNKFTIE
jgi:hypothetical protein